MTWTRDIWTWHDLTRKHTLDSLLDEALADEHAEARGMIVSVDHPVFGSLTQVANPIKIAGVDPQYRRAAALGEHTDAVLTELGGFSEEELRALREGGVI